MLPGYLWILVLGFICCCIQSFILGATSLCVVWGPLVGARVLSYRAALLLEITCQVIGNVAFGPHYLVPYSGVIKSETLVRTQPELVIYALLCIAFVLPLWHLLAYWQRVPISPFTQLATSLAGTALVFPGPRSIDWGSHLLSKAPFISGLGPVYIAWFIMPVVSLVCVTVLMLALRQNLRKEDSFYQVLWRLPAIACLTVMVHMSYILYALVSPTGFKLNTISSPPVIIGLCACGTAGCLLTSLLIPVLVKKFGLATPPAMQIRRMNLLGLPADVVLDLAADKRSADASGWFQYIWDHATQKDIFAVISRRERLMRIHTTAEQFEPAAERLFGPMQVVGAVLLSLAYNGNVFRSALGVGAGMLHIYKTAAVSDTFPVPIWMRCMAAVVTASGAFLGGGRLMPVTGVQLAKMTPFRSYVVVMGSCVASVFAKALNLDAFPVYISVSAIVAVGLTEGVDHVNWKKFFKIVAWWYLGCIPVFAVTAIAYWQGTRSPSAANLAQIQADNSDIKASNAVLRDALGGLLSMPQGVTQLNKVNPRLAELEMLQMGVQQLISAYNATLTHCTN